MNDDAILSQDTLRVLVTPAAHEKSIALTDLKWVLTEQAQSTLFSTFTLDARAL